MPTFERYLTLWVALCIVAGIALGQLLPGVFHAIGAAEVAHVNRRSPSTDLADDHPDVGKVDFAAMVSTRHSRQFGVTLFINWAVKPFSMAALGWLFIGHLFRPYLPAKQVDSYIAGLFFWSAAGVVS